MKKAILPLLLASAPVFAGEVAPIMAPAPQSCPQGFTLGLELLAFSPYQSEGEYDESDNDAGFRGSIGYEFGNCVFAKFTGMSYGTETDSDEDLDVSYYDLVVGQHFQPGDGFTLSPYIGGRIAKFDEDVDDVEFDGLGIVVGVDGTRTLTNNFSLYGTAKVSLLFGEDDGNDNDDTLVNILELGLGVQYDFTISNIASNVRVGVEGQWWNGASEDDSESSGLAGFVIGANFRF